MPSGILRPEHQRRQAVESVIQELDDSLRTLVRRDALNGAKVEISFDAPTKEWAARRNTPTVDLYLYDIREDLERRQVAWEPVHDLEARRVTERRPPSRRFRLSYLLTAWTQRAEDEHRLLSALLSCFVRNETMPVDLLTGSLTTLPLPVYLAIALPPPEDRSISDVWSALGGELKASLDLVVTAPFVVSRVEAAGPPVLEEPTISLSDSGGEADLAERRREQPRSVRPRKSPLELPLQDERIHPGKTEQGRTLRVRSLTSAAKDSAP